MEVAGYYGSLSRALAESGADVTHVDVFGTPFDFMRGPGRGRVIQLCSWLGRRRARAVRPRALYWWKSLHRLSMALLFLWAAPSHDIFIFGFRTSFLGTRELRLLRLLRKRLIFVFHGSDIRPAYINGGETAARPGGTIEGCLQSTRKKRRDLDRIERYADVIVSHPSFSQLLRRPFVSFLAVGIPAPLRDADAEAAGDGPIRILHSPSDPEVKGTARIREAMENLRAEGLELEYVEITGQRNAVVLDELRRCHFVVDQLYSDTPMASFATEAATMGRAAVVGSYDWREACNQVPDAHLPPTHRCHPHEIEDAVRRMAEDAAYREQLGHRARRFVRERWTPEAVARRFLRLIDGDVPPDWVCDPAAIRYVHGAGLDEKRLRELVGGVVDHGGQEELLLADKPELLRRVLQLAGR